MTNTLLRKTKSPCSSSSSIEKRPLFSTEFVLPAAEEQETRAVRQRERLQRSLTRYGANNAVGRKHAADLLQKTPVALYNVLGIVAADNGQGTAGPIVICVIRAPITLRRRVVMVPLSFEYPPRRGY